MTKTMTATGLGGGGSGGADETNKWIITAALDSCLLTDEEMEVYRTAQQQEGEAGCAAAFPNHMMQVHMASPPPSSSSSSQSSPSAKSSKRKRFAKNVVGVVSGISRRLPFSSDSPLSS